MFNGLVEEVGQVEAVEERKGASAIRIACQLSHHDLQVGDSLAVNGVCQTVVACQAGLVEVHAYQQTLRKTNLGLLQLGDRVNLERALIVGGRLHGYFMQGQVNATALLLETVHQQDNIYLRIEIGSDLLPYCLREGAICLDGVVLTIADIHGSQLIFNPSQHSWNHSNLRYRTAGDRLNVEVDQLARYVASFLDHQSHSREARQAPPSLATMTEVEVNLPTDFGDFSLSLLHCPREPWAEHLLLAHNLKQSRDRVPMIRIHSECLTGEVFHSQRCDCCWQLQTAMKEIQRHGCGAIIYLRQEGRGIGLRAKLHAYKLQQTYRLDTVDANLRLGYENDLRDYSVAIDTLKRLRIKQVQLMTNNPEKIAALENAGIKVERLALESSPNQHNLDYLRTKKSKSGHLFSQLHHSPKQATKE